jgi:hypothetical protein
VEPSNQKPTPDIRDELVRDPIGCREQTDNQQQPHSRNSVMPQHIRTLAQRFGFRSLEFCRAVQADQIAEGRRMAGMSQQQQQQKRNNKK